MGKHDFINNRLLLTNSNVFWIVLAARTFCWSTGSFFRSFLTSSTGPAVQEALTFSWQIALRLRVERPERIVSTTSFLSVSSLAGFCLGTEKAAAEAALSVVSGDSVGSSTSGSNVDYVPFFTPGSENSLVGFRHIMVIHRKQWALLWIYSRNRFL